MHRNNYDRKIFIVKGLTGNDNFHVSLSFNETYLSSLFSNQAQCYKTFVRLQFTNVCIQLDCLLE
jgi:hypothetical protein